MSENFSLINCHHDDAIENVSIEFSPDEVVATASTTIPQPELILAEVS